MKFFVMSFDMDLESVLKATVLEALLEKATSSQNKDTNSDAVSAFSRIISQEPETIPSAVRMILYKMQSANEWEAFQAIILLEACMENENSLFLAEVGKFRFLNELIKLVSPKYQGNTTPSLIKNKVIDLLKLWSIKYPQESKIKEAFEMLKRQGVLMKTSTEFENGLFSSPAALMSYPRADTFGDDEKDKTLQKLLRSNKPSDLKAANHLIKTMVKEKEDREDMRLIANNARLLSEMLSNIGPDSSQQDIELIKELKETCVSMKPTLAYLISCYSKTTRDSVELIELNDLMNDTLQMYNDKMALLNKPIAATSSSVPITVPVSISVTASQTSTNHISSSPPTLLDLSSPDNCAPVILSSSPKDSGNILLENKTCKSTADTLEEIFNNTLYTLDRLSAGEVEEQNNDSGYSSNPTQLFQDLNALGKSYLETNNIPSSSKNESKTTLNDLAGKLTAGNAKDYEDELLNNDDELLHDDDLAVSQKLENETNETSDMWTTSSKKIVSIPETKITETPKTVEPLHDISVALVDIKTGTNEKLTIMEDRDGIFVYIQLTENKPREDVSVFLVLCNSKRTEQISNFIFQPVVSKDCRLKLQPPSKYELPPYNPYIPAETIVQIMLIATPKREFISMKFVVSYNLEDEMITEMGEVESLPLKICS